MPNNGNFWSDEEVDQLLSDYKKRGDKKIYKFCKEWGKLHNRNANSVSSKLRNVINSGHTSRKTKEDVDEERESTNVEYGEDYINVVCASRRIRSQEDAIKEFNIDLD